MIAISGKVMPGPRSWGLYASTRTPSCLFMYVSKQCVDFIKNGVNTEESTNEQLRELAMGPPTASSAEIFRNHLEASGYQLG